MIVYCVCIPFTAKTQRLYNNKIQYSLLKITPYTGSIIFFSTEVQSIELKLFNIHY